MQGDVCSLALAVLKWALIDLYNKLRAASVLGLYAVCVISVVRIVHHLCLLCTCKAISIGKKFFV